MKEQNVILNYPWITHKDVFLKFQGTPESEHPLITLEYVYFRVSIQRNEKCSLASFILRWSSRELPKKSVLPLSHIDRLSQYAPQHTVRGQIRNPRVCYFWKMCLQWSKWHCPLEGWWSCFCQPWSQLLSSLQCFFPSFPLWFNFCFLVISPPTSLLF